MTPRSLGAPLEHLGVLGVLGVLGSRGLFSCCWGLGFRSVRVFFSWFAGCPSWQGKLFRPQTLKRLAKQGLSSTSTAPRLGLEVTRAKKKYRLLSHNGSLKVTGAPKKV